MENDLMTHQTYLIRVEEVENETEGIVCGVLEYSAPEGVIEMSNDVYYEIQFVNVIDVA